MDKNFKVSIISVNFNDKINMEKTIKSVLLQTYNNIEHIIIDGGSSDGSVDIIKQYEPLYKGKLKWISEPDKGIADACNKGLKIATGDIINIFIDEYASIYTVEKMVTVIEKKNADGACSGMFFVNKNNKVIRIWSGKKGSLFLGWMPATPSLFLKKNIHDRYGLSSTDYIAAADYDYDIRILKDKTINIISIKELLVYYTAGGVSNNGINSNINGIKETYKALKNNNMPLPWFTTLCKCIIAFCAYLFASRKTVILDDLISNELNEIKKRNN